MTAAACLFTTTLALLYLAGCNDRPGTRISTLLPPEKIGYLIFGRDCNINSKLPLTKMFKVTNDHLIVMPRGGYFYMNETCHGCDTVKDGRFEKACELKNALPRMLLDTENYVTTEADREGRYTIYLEFALQDSVYRCSIDPESRNLPVELDSLSKKVNSLISTISPGI